MTLEVVSWADFSCVLHLFSNRTRLEGAFGAQLGRKTAENSPQSTPGFLIHEWLARAHLDLR